MALAPALGALPLLLGLAHLCRFGAGAIWSPSSSDSVEVRSSGRLIRSHDPPPRKARGRSLEVGPAGEVVGAAPEADALAKGGGPPSRRAATPLGDRCSRAVGKAEKLLSFYAADLAAAGQIADAKLELALQSLRARDKERLSADDILEALGDVDLGTALRSGHVWTVEDQWDLFDGCVGGRALLALEERARTPSGELLLQGDVLPAAAEEETANRTAALGITDWPDGRVPYCFLDGLDASSRRAFLAAVGHVRDQVPCLSFEEVPSEPGSDRCSAAPAIAVGGRAGVSGCWSGVGMRADKQSQRLNLGRGCGLMGVAAHQLLQALGATHELSHHRRDEFMDLIAGNADAFTFDTNFRINRGVAGPSLADFDPLSLMTGSAKAFSANGKDTVELKVVSKEGVSTRLPLLSRLLGQRHGLSEIDARRLGERYGCAERVVLATPTRRLSNILLAGGGLKVEGGCADANYTGLLAEGVAGAVDLQCRALKDRCRDPELSPRLAQRCPLTCMTCVPVPEVELEAGEPLKAVFEQVDLDDDSAADTFRVPSWRCKDSLATGVKFKNGGTANCPELYNYCNHLTLAEHIKRACPMTCGMCVPFVLKQVSNSSSSSVASNAPCEDDAASHVPVLFMGRKVMSCADIKDFCFGHWNSRFIARKCKVTCGVCELPDAELDQVDLMEPITTTPAPAVAAAAEPDPKYDQYDGPSCSRRRRWGLCSSRRRNGAPGDPAADDADPSHVGHNWEARRTQGR